MLPLLVLVADIIGVFGGFLIGVYRLDFNPAAYIGRTWEYLEPMDVISGLVKAGVFGFVIALMDAITELPVERRRAGRGSRHHQRGRLLVHPDPGVQLPDHRSGPSR